MDGTTVWKRAIAKERKYITPEDVDAAIDAGAAQLDIWREVLQAVEAKAAEDASLCAFVALTRFDQKVVRRQRDGTLHEA
jgi:hypothetical protein